MTRNQAIRRHRIRWRWQAENPKAAKSDWPGLEENGGKYNTGPNDCFLCAFGCCLLDWPTENCMRTNSLYMKWSGTEELKLRSYYARRIAELPVRQRKRSKK